MFVVYSFYSSRFAFEQIKQENTNKTTAHDKEEKEEEKSVLDFLTATPETSNENFLNCDGEANEEPLLISFG